MKKLLSLLLSLPFLSATAFSRDAKTPEWVPPYTIVKSVEDPALKKSEAVFVFQFKASGSAIAAHAIRLSYNGTEKTVHPDLKGETTLKLTPGNYKFQFFYNTDHLEIYTDSIVILPGYRTTMELRFESSLIPTVAEKPVIYVYPEKTQQVKINLDVKGELQFTYPAYQNGWSFTANPDGTIQLGGKQYDYLFWDAQTNVRTDVFQTGFVVSRDSLLPFFEKQLDAMGLNPRETQDFITYWCPRMMQNEKSVIHFEFNSGCDQFAGMEITPRPDHLFRVFMVWADAAQVNCAGIKSQSIEKANRSGFTVVEWGGAAVENGSVPVVTK